MSILNLLIHRHNVEVYSYSVKEHDTIRSFPFFNSQTTVVSHNQILLPSLSFAFYQLKDDDHVFVYEHSCPAEAAAHPQRMRAKFQTPPELLDPKKRGKHFMRALGYVPDTERMQAIIDEMTDPALAREVSVIKDRFYHRVEGNYILNRRVMCKYAQLRQVFDRNYRTESAELKIGAALSEPSTEELPPLWSV